VEPVLGSREGAYPAASCTAFKDQAISGARGRERRPGLDKLLQAVARREVDLVAAWSVDRLGRSLQDLLGVLGEIHAKGCELYMHQQGIDTRTPAGKALFQMMGVFAEFERAIIVERVKSGLKRAKAQGKRLGRPRKDDPALVADIERLRTEGMGINKVAARSESVRAMAMLCAPRWKCTV
jgi:DNA invertase Pin-like site-specific DNA recombinase